jgi:hypothetical protein
MHLSHVHQTRILCSQYCMSLIVNVGTKIMFDRMSNIIKIDVMCVATVISLPRSNP